MKRIIAAGIGVSFSVLLLAADMPSGMIAGASAPAVISSVVVPPTQERSVMFTDRGRTFLVGMTSGRVIVVDGSIPTPVIPPSPVNPPAPPLTGISKQVYESIMASPITPQNRKLGAVALIGAIDSTLSEAGGLGITDTQSIVNTLANNAEAARVNTLLTGWKLGDLLAGANITTKEQLVKALEDIKAGLAVIP